MSNTYNEITNQCFAVRNDTSTLAFYINVQPAAVEQFMELVEGKVKISLYDYSNGKGDKGVWTYFNLDLDDVEYLYERAKMFYMPDPFYGNKIMGMAPVRDGPYKGMCPVTKIMISRTDSTSSGDKMRNPWSINISNGYAWAARGKKAGTFYEKSGTYIETGKTKMSLTDKNFLFCMKKIHQYLMVNSIIVGSKLIPQGMKLLDEKYNQRGYSNEIAPQNAQEYIAESYNDQSLPVQSQNTQIIQSAPVQPVQQPASQPENVIEYHPTVVSFATGFQALENNIYIASCLAGGNEYTVYFPTVPEELITASQNQLPIRVNLYMKNNKFWFHSIAA